jgi:hypothetical protein
MLSAIRPIKLFLTIQHGLCVVAAQTVVARAGCGVWKPAAILRPHLSPLLGYPSGHARFH